VEGVVTDAAGFGADAAAAVPTSESVNDVVDRSGSGAAAVPVALAGAPAPLDEGADRSHRAVASRHAVDRVTAVARFVTRILTDVKALLMCLPSIARTRSPWVCDHACSGTLSSNGSPVTQAEAREQQGKR
jgi:hypothetical protein